MALFVLLFPFMAAIHSAGGAEFDYRQYEALLKGHVTKGIVIDGIAVNAVDYAALAEAAQRPESEYTLLMKELAAFDPRTLETGDDKKAFWINVYNIAAIETIVDHYPVDSIRSRSIHYLPDEDRTFLEKEEVSIEYLDYNWKVNDRRR